MSHNTIFSCASLNVRSISGVRKSKQVLNHLKTFPADVLFLQGMHVYSSETIEKLSRNWEGKSFWSPGSLSSSGTAILFRRHLNINILDFKQDFEGRVMSTLVSYGHLKINLISIYAPNTLRERKLFFQNLHEFFFTGSELIIGGDFNCIDSQKDKYGGNFDTGFVGKQEISKLKSDFYLTDIWWKKIHASFNSLGSMRMQQLLVDLTNFLFLKIWCNQHAHVRLSHVIILITTLFSYLLILVPFVIVDWVFGI